MIFLKYIIIRKLLKSMNPAPTMSLNDKYIELASDEAYQKYLGKYGHHFNEKLSEYASKMLKNSNNYQHTWSFEQVKKAMKNLGFSVPEKLMGDVVYLANLSYSMFVPTPIKEEISCFDIAYKMLMNPNGYEGKIFDEWINDMMKKEIHVEWEKFV